MDVNLLLVIQSVVEDGVKNLGKRQWMHIRGCTRDSSSLRSSE